MDIRKIIQAIDHTNLDPCATEEDILAFAAAAYPKGHTHGTGIASLCVQPCYVKALAQHFPGGVPICTVVGFPHGCEPAAVKAAAARQAFADGASEVDMVLALGRIKAGDYSAVQRDVAAVLAERPAGGKVKVILETGALTDEEILGTVQALNQLDIDFYKTSTGFGYPGASVHAAELIMQAKRPEIQLKVSGGIRTIEDAEQYLRLGATRIGASKLLAACMQRLRVPLG